MIKRLVLVGGDDRAKAVAALPEAGRMWIKTLGLEQNENDSCCIENTDALLFPYPYSVKNGYVPSPKGEKINPKDVLLKARSGITLLLGKGMEDILHDEAVAAKSFKVKHYADDSGFIHANSEISAEAAVFETMKRLDKTLDGSTIAVTGYGIFARGIAKRLMKLGAAVWIAARREEQRLLAASDGAHPLSLEELHFITPSTDALINTVPAHVLYERALMLLKKGAPVLDMASAPYGADMNDIDRYRLWYELLPALPASYAPVSAARALFKASIRLLSEDML